jgi:hypothetical protein
MDDVPPSIVHRLSSKAGTHLRFEALSIIWTLQHHQRPFSCFTLPRYADRAQRGMVAVAVVAEGETPRLEQSRRAFCVVVWPEFRRSADRQTGPQWLHYPCPLLWLRTCRLREPRNAPAEARGVFVAIFIIILHPNHSEEETIARLERCSCVPCGRLHHSLHVFVASQVLGGLPERCDLR